MPESSASLTACFEPPSSASPDAGRRAVGWLRTLAELLDVCTCRRRGREAPLAQGLDDLHRLWRRQHVEDRAVYWIGNGGSAALASHLAQDLLRAGRIRSQALTDSSLLTCTANDHGYQDVFRRPLTTLGRAGDALVAISSSGMSPNVVSAAEASLQIGMTLVTVSAFSPDNALRALPAALAFHAPTECFGHAELAHGALLHSTMGGLVQADAD